ncbi:hypothetical protein [Pseudomonas brassicacearum]|uniref:hypothetical protein n=1 Tax=Pseudomonas brassicacearum TaxID=930166 RepID=UPI0011CD3B90|nr:hypothetical protein [Pseudomonas brassicacearum]
MQLLEGGTVLGDECINYLRPCKFSGRRMHQTVRGFNRFFEFKAASHASANQSALNKEGGTLQALTQNRYIA